VGDLYELRAPEPFEAIARDEGTSGVLLRLAALAHDGRLGVFMNVVAADEELDPFTKTSLHELARDEAFLFAVEDYLLGAGRN